LSIDGLGIVGFNAIAMMRPHTSLFEAATDTPAAGGFPADFSNNTVQDTQEFVNTGEVHEPGATAPTAPVAPAQPALNPLQQPQHTQPPQNDVVDTEPQPLPATMQPVAPVEPAATVQPVADPVAAMAAAIRLADSSLSNAEVAQRVAAALQGSAPPEPAAPEVDPDSAALEDLNVRLEALRTQAETEGTSDYDADIQKLDREALLLQARLEVRSELAQQDAANEFASQAAKWDDRAGKTYPDADIEGSALNLAIKAKALEVSAADPDYFHRSPRAGFDLVAIVAAERGIAPKTTQGGVPTPQTPQPIQAPAVVQGQQAPHRPAPQAPMDATQAWLASIKAAEQGGFGAELALARSSDLSFGGVQFRA